MVRNIRVTLAYDGTEFSGWQVQKNARTVQGEIEEALRRMHDHPVRIQGAGRTDSGVHASGQVGNFYTDLDSITPSRWHVALNSYLPPDVRALDSREVAFAFNAKNNARRRVYRYFLYTGSVGPPHLRLYCWKIRRRPELRRLNALAAVFLGEHDFTTFAAAGDLSKSKVRRVDTACFFPEGPFLCFKVAASSFVWKMVRSILGTILEYERNALSPADLAGALAARDRSRAGMSAPARGLFLERVVYDGDEEI
ncbi:MAG: tRNA pseudouridine(38-40) synthase TruA [Spirochaetaceae bacterium]|nr:MAG: tRNA pseudouridine(38-40) synthase TruA [Spirochaetaceae bacterium]